MKQRKRHRCDKCRQKTNRSDSYGWGFLCHTCKKHFKSSGAWRMAVFGLWVTKAKKMEVATNEAIEVAKWADGYRTVAPPPGGNPWLK